MEQSLLQCPVCSQGLLLEPVAEADPFSPGIRTPAQVTLSGSSNTSYRQQASTRLLRCCLLTIKWSEHHLRSIRRMGTFQAASRHSSLLSSSASVNSLQQ